MGGKRVAVLGLGRMGEPMASCWLRAGHPVAVWNRTPDKASGLLAAGATGLDRPAEAATADVVVLMLTGADATREVLFESGLAGALRPGTVVLDMSTIAPAAARAHASEVAVPLLDAPVSGGVVGAAEGRLTIFVGGERAAFDQVSTVLAAVGRPHWLGPAGAGQTGKCVNQLIVGVTIAAVAEGLTLARRAGLDPAALAEALQGGFADSRILREHGARMLERRFEPGGTITNTVKDMRAVLATAASAGCRLPATELVAALYEQADARGLGPLDHSGLLLEIERRSDEWISA